MYKEKIAAQKQQLKRVGSSEKLPKTDGKSVTDLILKSEGVCGSVDAFMAAMKDLQACVNRKEKNLTPQKLAFEHTKQALLEAVDGMLMNIALLK